LDIILKYFPDLTEDQKYKFSILHNLYEEWNNKINVISRKDIESLYERHILHSLAIGKVIQFKPGTRVLDVGTGGGFPGIPLAVLFPEVHFHLVDSIGKKIKVVNEVKAGLGLKNVIAEQNRAENIRGQYDFVVSRAVTRMAPFYSWIRDKFLRENKNDLDNGILYLKGGDLDEELSEVHKPYRLFDIPDFFSEEFFETKKVVYIPVS
jgi:16S rRNA (guanine527-N7)-methyltransferase